MQKLVVGMAVAMCVLAGICAAAGAIYNLYGRPVKKLKRVLVVVCSILTIWLWENERWKNLKKL